MRVGTPPVIQMAVLDAALDVWDGVAMADIRARSVALSERFVAGRRGRLPGTDAGQPARSGARGSQVSFRHEQGYAIVQALIARGVIGDFRAPDILRFGIAPLYLGEAEIDRAIDALAEVMADGRLGPAGIPRPARR
jgi:kynureninase